MFSITIVNKDKGFLVILYLDDELVEEWKYTEPVQADFKVRYLMEEYL